MAHPFPLPAPWDWATHPPPGITPQLVKFDDELASAEGVSVWLFAEGHSRDTLTEAGRWLKANRDVVGRIRHAPEGQEWGWLNWYRRRKDGPVLLAALGIDP